VLALKRHDQYDGRSALGIRGRSDTRGTRGWYGGRVGRSSRTCPAWAGTWKDLTDKRERHGEQPGRIRCEISRFVDDGGRPTAICRRRSPVEARGRSSWTSRTPSTTWWKKAAHLSPTKCRAWAREVGTEGVLGRPGERSWRGRKPWKGLTDKRERDGRANLTAQVRNIADVTTGGRRRRRPVAEDHGERAGLKWLELKNTINHDGRSAQRIRKRK